MKRRPVYEIEHLGHSRLYQKPEPAWFTPGNLAVLTLVSFIVGIVAGTISGL